MIKKASERALAHVFLQFRWKIELVSLIPVVAVAGFGH
ncbi:hypothetical protein VCBJG01_0110 [Vibrio cholerae BJG-01]|nr:hypothetical protein VCBJG01_0110 [Vibrio cholerae BJG-01]EKY32160.1 hypothetical protein OSU_2174 [Vibrio cholerae PS15]